MQSIYHDSCIIARTPRILSSFDSMCTLQIAACRPIPILPDLSHPGDTILADSKTLGYSLPTQIVPELETLYVRILGEIAKYAYRMICNDSGEVQDMGYAGEDGEGYSGMYSSDDEGGGLTSRPSSRGGVLSSKAGSRSAVRSSVKGKIGNGQPFSEYSINEVSWRGYARNFFQMEPVQIDQKTSFSQLLTCHLLLH